MESLSVVAYRGMLSLTSKGYIIIDELVNNIHVLQLWENMITNV